MKRSQEDKAATRELILKTASKHFRKFGGSVGINDLMSSAGLTHGGFYRHFESKDQLFIEACDQALNSLIDKIELSIKRRQGPNNESALEAIVSMYLSPSHRDGLSTGCVFAALGGDIARAGTKAKATLSPTLNRLLSLIAAHLQSGTDEWRHQKAEFIFSSMMGAMTMSRCLQDKHNSDAFLENARAQILQCI